MMFTDLTPKGRSFVKDPCVVWFQGAYYLYYSKPIFHADGSEAFGIGIARSSDLDHWEVVGAIEAEQPAEGNGICAPGGIVLDGVLHLFYQSYGQFPRDYICHATSTDGLHFDRDSTNPIVKPTGDWNNGRAIDADVAVMGDTLYLYWATRDPKGEIQMLGVSTADAQSGFHREDFTQRSEAPLLRPELDWETACIEAPAALSRDGRMYLFYAGGYNCDPQQVGCAVSEDGVHFTRMTDQPLLRNGAPGSWNASESGHPYVFEHEGTVHLFYQGSDDRGGTWRISRTTIDFSGEVPKILV